MMRLGPSLIALALHGLVATTALAQDDGTVECPLIENVVSNAILTVGDYFHHGTVFFPVDPSPTIVVRGEYDTLKFYEMRRQGIAVLTPGHFQVVSTGIVSLAFSGTANNAITDEYPTLMLETEFSDMLLDILGDDVIRRDRDGRDMIGFRLVMGLNDIGASALFEPEHGNSISITVETSYTTSPMTDIILTNMGQTNTAIIHATARCGVAERIYNGDMRVVLEALSMENPETGHLTVFTHD